MPSRPLKIPDIWRRFGGHFHQDFMYEFPNPLLGFRRVFDGFSIEQRSELHRFLAAALRSDLTRAELGKLWGRSGASIVFYRIDARDFFELLLSDLESSIEADRRAQSRARARRQAKRRHHKAR